jgi:hypothetical protein
MAGLLSRTLSAVVMSLSLRQVIERINLLIPNENFEKTEAAARNFAKRSWIDAVQNTLSDKIRVAAIFRLEGVF